jgi:hypothetical protein
MRRQQLRARNALDVEDERGAAEVRTPEQGLVLVLELSEVIRELARANGVANAPEGDLEEKAWLYARPLRALRRP